MNLYRFKLTPESAWRTPWQSDTLSGMLCGMIAQSEGGAVLRNRVIEPALAGRPPFVLSDAFSGDWLPVPTFVRGLNWPADQRKRVKKACWLTRNSFQAIQRGNLASLEVLETDGFHESVHLHNTIGRSTNTTSDGGALFPREETHLAKGFQHLTVYARVRDDFRALFLQALGDLAKGGFGADRSAGRGQFAFDGTVEPINLLDQVQDPDGAIVLSSFQPSRSDPVDGAWDSFTKYGKLGPEFGLENVFKRPFVLLRPGASFRLQPFRAALGRAIPMDQVLSQSTCVDLRGRNVEIIHYAFGLALPFVWPKSNEGGQLRFVAVTEAVAPPTPASPPTSKAPVLSAAKPKPTLPAPKPVDPTVEVTLLERMEKAGPNAFRVQEEGKPRGMLVDGMPPNPLPEIGAKIRVFREPTSQANNPRYRWSKPEPSTPPRGRGPHRGGKR